MFSDLGREGFSAEKARARDNLIDIVAKAGLGVDWYGNNTNCKGICRAAGEKRAVRENHPDHCKADVPCTDGAIFEDFWSTLPAYSGRGLVVLHQGQDLGFAASDRWQVRTDHRDTAIELTRPSCLAVVDQDEQL